MTITFTAQTAVEVADLTGTADPTTMVYWHIDDPEQAPVVVDVLGRKMLVHRVSLHIADGEQRLYLGGFPASKVSNRNVSTDSFLTMIDLDDHWATFAELLLDENPIELPSITSPTYGEVNPTGAALVDG